LSRARLILVILSVYIFAAFTWWTYAHCLNSKVVYEQKKEIVELSCYKATFDLQGAIDQELFEDSIGMRKFFISNYPNLEVIILDPFLPLDNFMVRPTLSCYESLEKELNRKLFMYVAEGVVMMLLLLFGIVIIYRSFKKELLLNKLQNNFLLSVTHELKTPLTAMKLYMETLLKRHLNSEQILTIAQNSLNETERLKDQVEKLLLSAQLDSSKYVLDKHTINLSELTEEFVLNYNKPRPEKEAIGLDIQDQIILKADATAIEMILSNLVGNAVKYAGNSGKIRVALKQDGNSIILSVEDNGPGISDVDKKLLFNKFYRSGDENTRKTKGTGLGLFIVKHLVQLHNGKVNVLNNEPNGIIFQIKLESDAD
jgi:signal transduction histidine kinase